MGQALRQWWRYPFAVAGPFSVLLAIALALSGAIPASVRGVGILAIVPGFLVLYGGGEVGRVARRFFAKRRGMEAPQIRQPIRRQLAWGIYTSIVVVVLLLRDWSLGWYWVAVAAGSLGNEAVRRRKWAKRGYPGDPRWGWGWRPDSDPAYEFRAIPLVKAGRYEEAEQLLYEALEIKPGDPSSLYILACAEALAGETETALHHLNEAVAGDEHLRKGAQKDPDLASIRDDPRFPR